MFALIVITACTQHTQESHHHVDEIEINHVYDQNGCRTLSQIILWTDTPDGMRVVDWRLLKGETMWPRKLPSGEYVSLWCEKGEVFKVYAARSRETWSQGWDPEVANRELLPRCERRGIR